MAYFYISHFFYIVNLRGKILGLLSNKVIIEWSKNNKKRYTEKGYIFTEFGMQFEVNVYDLPITSLIKVDVSCDVCGNKFKMLWQSYNLRKNDKCYCKKCIKTFKKGDLSFTQWCINSNRTDILDRWDNNLNNISPDLIAYSTNKKYWFTCDKGIHGSELKSINSLTSVKDKKLTCNQCNSFAQWGIDNLGNDFLDNYWSDKNTVNPYSISKGSKNMVYIKCQNNSNHEDYVIRCDNFISGSRCNICGSRKLHKTNSLAYLYKEATILWSEKNTKQPSEYLPHSMHAVWWKCHNGVHNDYIRDIHNSTRFNFRCPSCSFSVGEKAIEDILIKNNIYYIPQFKDINLLGIRNGYLSFDFYLPLYNLLIEFQGIQHYEPTDFYRMGIEHAKQSFKIQQENDEIKRVYANENNFKLLEICYLDFNKIEEILNKELGIIPNSFVV